MNSLKIFDIFREHYSEIVITSGHKKAANDRRAVPYSGFESLQGLFALAFKRYSYQHGCNETKLG